MTDTYYSTAFLHWPATGRKEWVELAEIHLQHGRAPVVRLVRGDRATGLPRRVELVMHAPLAKQYRVAWRRRKGGWDGWQLVFYIYRRTLRPPRGTPPVATDAHRLLMATAAADGRKVTVGRG